jgi:hypothetical protein
MLDLVMGPLAAVDVSVVGDLLAKPRAYRLTDVVSQVVPAAGYKVAP